MLTNLTERGGGISLRRDRLESRWVNHPGPAPEGEFSTRNVFVVPVPRNVREQVVRPLGERSGRLGNETMFKTGFSPPRVALAVVLSTVTALAIAAPLTFEAIEARRAAGVATDDFFDAFEPLPSTELALPTESAEPAPVADEASDDAESQTIVAQGAEPEEDSGPATTVGSGDQTQDRPTTTVPAKPADNTDDEASSSSTTTAGPTTTTTAPADTDGDPTTTTESTSTTEPEPVVAAPPDSSIGELEPTTVPDHCDSERDDDEFGITGVPTTAPLVEPKPKADCGTTTTTTVEPTKELPRAAPTTEAGTTTRPETRIEPDIVPQLELELPPLTLGGALPAQLQPLVDPQLGQA